MSSVRSAGQLLAARVTFEQLCGVAGLRRALDDGGALAAPDCLALARAVPTLLLRSPGVPQFTAAQRDEARRCA